MRIDLYTKTILTFIALLLAVVALKPVVAPTAVDAQASLGGIQLSVSSTELWAIDNRSGDIWVYNAKSGAVILHRRITQAGKPLILDQ